MLPGSPSSRSILQSLAKSRLAEIGRDLGIALSPGTREAQLASLEQARFSEVLRALGRDELRAACRAHGLDDSGRSRPALAARLIQAHGSDEAAPAARFARREGQLEMPEEGDIVHVRHRQYLVEKVTLPPEDGQQTLVKLCCLDDDAQGRRMEVFWELELGARVLEPETHGLGEVRSLDAPRTFAAYLHALKWNAVTATDAKLFQAPFRAGIQLKNHQLTPLKKALELPRANLFIADDVGLGKTIEAGLVLQELLLRQRVAFALIVAPAAICLQWQGEMEKRFGLRFEIYNRAFVGRRRQERGFAVNPWTTHSRFIISYQTLRRPEHRDPLLQVLGARAAKSLLILDEAHTAAPASASKYAVDSHVTGVVRDVAPRFENRLFLSATPHNGHSNSFSALLEILDPQRFTRGVPVRSARQLEPVMVRRLKADLREIGADEFPVRKIVELLVGDPGSPELVLARKLAEYTRLMRPKRGRGQLVFINLQKRLLSSVAAFHRTLDVHARSVEQGRATTALQLDLADARPAALAPALAPAPAPAPLDDDDDERGADDDSLEEEQSAEVARASRLIQSPEGQARQLLAEMLELAERRRGAADAKVHALIDWIREHQCRAVRLGGAEGTKAERRWSDRRLIVFTEYGDTKRYLQEILATAVEGTDGGGERILQFHGGMSDEGREEVQRAFNGPPGEHPVRILLATDAAREGVNLQGHCADLVHFDIPWNPARMEQRNGRIDRTLQPAPEVRCHYFRYPDRAEDLVLARLVQKVDVIQRELGSLGSVVMDRMADVLVRGIDEQTDADLDVAEQVAGRRETARRELEAQRERARLEADIDEAGRILNSSRRVMDFDPVLLRDAIDVGLALAGAGRLEPLAGEDGAFTLPPMPESWQATLDLLRPPRERGEAPWDHRKRPPQPVVFSAPASMTDRRVHLHLQHPFVQRVQSRFLAQGTSVHDLSRVTVVRNRHDSLVRIIAFGRLSLFGQGATRLHDQLVSVAAQWRDGGGAGHLKPFADKADRRALELLEQILADSQREVALPARAREHILRSAPDDFAALWPHIRDEADSLSHEAERKLAARAAEESEALRRILEDQRAAIDATLADTQLSLDFSDSEKAQRDQLEQDRRHLEGRRGAIDREIETEPAQIREVYRVVLHRLEPVGLVYLWPETRS